MLRWQPTPRTRRRAWVRIALIIIFGSATAFLMFVYHWFEMRGFL